MSFKKIVPPTIGEKITVKDGKLNIPDQPIVAFIEGDGIGYDIMTASRRIWDAAVEKAYGGARKIHWMEIYAGQKATGLYGGSQFLPEETLDALERREGAAPIALTAGPPLRRRRDPPDR